MTDARHDARGERTSVAGLLRPARVARIPYLNSAPFYVSWSELEPRSEGLWTSVDLPPRQLGQAAEAGEIDAGLMALADLTRLEDQFEPIVVPAQPERETFGIANQDRVESVLLFVRAARVLESPSGAHSPSPRFAAGQDLSRAEAHRLDGATIGVTGETSTSFRLLRLLLEVRYGVQPESYRRLPLALDDAITASGPDALDAALVIGDLALRWQHRPPAGFVQAIDLSAAWRDWKDLPFVFARWSVRRELPDEAKVWLGRFLGESLSRGLSRLPELTRDLPADLGDREHLTSYLRGFTYRLGAPEEEAAAEYQRLVRRHGLLTEPGPVTTPPRFTAP